MVINIMIGIILLLPIAALYTLAKMVQCSRFGAFMHNTIDDLYETDKHMTMDLNIRSSYDNLKRSAPWNYNFQDMIVYEKTT